jgi:hypothetical protein
MLHRVMMWIAVASLGALGVVSAISWVISLGVSNTNGWTFYTPNSQPSPSLMNALLLCGQAEQVLLPVAAISSAAHIYISDRASRQARGFDLDSERPMGGG